MTTLEWKALKNHGLNLHPWKVTMVGKIMSKLRREMGDEIWMALTDTLNSVRISRDMATWHSVLKPYYEKSLVVEREQKEQDIKTKKIQEIDKQRQALIKTRAKEETVRVKPTTNVIRRKREINNEASNTERFLN